jgi:hypothetical protein
MRELESHCDLAMRVLESHYKFSRCMRWKVTMILAISALGGVMSLAVRALEVAVSLVSECAGRC